MKKKRKCDYKPIKITGSDYCTLIDVKPEDFPQKAKDYDKYFDIYLLKWDIKAKCSETDEIGSCYQYRLYHKWPLFILHWIPSMIETLLDALLIYGLRAFRFPNRLYRVTEVKNGVPRGAYGPSDFWEWADTSAKEEFSRIEEFWDERFEEAVNG